MFRKLIALAAIPAAVVALSLPASAASHPQSGFVASAHCQSSGQFSDLTLNLPVFNLGVVGGVPVRGAALDVATSAAGEGFYLQAQPGGLGCYIEYAPIGVRSGLCVSEPSTAVRTAIVLRKCRANNPWQTWRAADLDNTGVYRVAVNLASGLAISDPSSGGNGTPLVSRHPGFGSAGNELWTASDAS